MRENELEGVCLRTRTGHKAYDVAVDGRFLMVEPKPVSPAETARRRPQLVRKLERFVPRRALFLLRVLFFRLSRILPVPGRAGPRRAHE